LTQILGQPCEFQVPAQARGAVQRDAAAADLVGAMVLREPSARLRIAQVSHS
jgi:hypothetical protein